jgi:hypothetical protein
VTPLLWGATLRHRYPHAPGAVRSVCNSTSEGAEEIKMGDSAGRNGGPDQRDANP